MEPNTRYAQTDCRPNRQLRYVMIQAAIVQHHQRQPECAWIKLKRQLGSMFSHEAGEPDAFFEVVDGERWGRAISIGDRLSL